MASLIGWVDYSEDHRRRMREVIDLFRDKNTIDELGIGQVRDALADRLFPGLSTIQTAARYFLFVPWVALRMEREKVSSRDADRVSRRLQTDLVNALKASGATGGQGVIGYDAGYNLQRLPSTVYWHGLGTFGIRRFSGSVADYHRSLDGYKRRLQEFRSEEGGARGDGEELADRFQPNWDPLLPGPPDDLWSETTLDLHQVEAEYLAERIRFTQPRSLQAHLLDHRQYPLDAIHAPWDHPAIDMLPAKTRGWLEHARMFSDVMLGAPLVFNMMLGERAQARGFNVADPHSPDAYRERLEDWADDLDRHRGSLDSWDAADFWSSVLDVNPGVRYATRTFIDRWIEHVTTDLESVVACSGAVRQLIADRERRQKGANARLFSDRALELWSGSAGTARLVFRWPTVARMLTDISEGLDRARP